MRARRAALAVTAIALIGPVTAEASISVAFNRTTGNLEITDATGAADVITVRSRLVSTKVDVTITSTQGFGSVDGNCSPPNTDDSGRPQTSCEADFAGVLGNLGAGNDDWTTASQGLFRNINRTGPVTVNGGLGNDVIRGGADDDRLNGDDGADQLLTGSGFDSLNGGVGTDSLTDQDVPSDASSDTLSGGPDADFMIVRGGNDVARGDAGADTIFEEDFNQIRNTIDGGTEFDKLVLDRSAGVSIADRDTTADVFLDFPFRQNAELEESPANIESFEGTHQPDVISGALSTALAGRTYHGRGGADVVLGTPRDDSVIGGNGRDVVKGNAGNDRLDAKAGEGVAVPDEQLDCGAGTDSASIDLTDPDPVGCETVARSAIGEGPHLRIGSVRHVGSGTYAVRLRCPRRLRHRCRGRLELALTLRELGPARGRRYSIRAGRRRTLRVRLTRRDARRLRETRRRRGFVRSTEKGDVAGKKTTLGRRRLRR